MTPNLVTPLPSSQPLPPRYALRRGLGVWEVTFNGERALLKENAGLLYVAYLLTMQPPGEPIHGLALSLRAAALYQPAKTVPQLPGLALPVDTETELPPASLAFKEAQVLWALWRRQWELEAIVDDRRHIEPVRTEALLELVTIYQHHQANLARTLLVAQRSVQVVRSAIQRFHQQLAQALDATGAPHPALRALAAHIQLHLLRPSDRCWSCAGLGRCGAMADSFVYEPPMGLTWAA